MVVKLLHLQQPLAQHEEIVEILAKTDLRTIFQTLTEPTVPKFYLQIILLTSSRSHHFTTQ